MHVRRVMKPCKLRGMKQIWLMHTVIKNALRENFEEAMIRSNTGMNISAHQHRYRFIHLILSDTQYPETHLRVFLASGSLPLD